MSFLIVTFLICEIELNHLVLKVHLLLCRFRGEAVQSGIVLLTGLLGTALMPGTQMCSARVLEGRTEVAEVLKDTV